MPRAIRPIPIPNESCKARFWAKVEIKGPDDCWPWMGYRDAKGYGSFQLGSPGSRPAHRVAYVLTNGEPPAEKPQVCHHCDNPPCCNPRHLFPGDNADNMLDKEKKGRGNHARGEANKQSSLTIADVIEIRRLRFVENKPYTEIAPIFGITDMSAGDVCRGKTWGHVPLAVGLQDAAQEGRAEAAALTGP